MRHPFASLRKIARLRIQSFCVSSFLHSNRAQQNTIQELQPSWTFWYEVPLPFEGLSGYSIKGVVLMMMCVIRGGGTVTQRTAHWMLIDFNEHYYWSEDKARWSMTAISIQDVTHSTFKIQRDYNSTTKNHYRIVVCWLTIRETWPPLWVAWKRTTTTLVSKSMDAGHYTICHHPILKVALLVEVPLAGGVQVLKAVSTYQYWLYADDALLKIRQDIYLNPP